MVLVVFYHSIVFWRGDWFCEIPVFTSDIFKYVAEWLNSFHIYGFTLVSGYLFYYLKYEKGKYREFIPFVINKVKRLIVPYVFVSAVWVIPISLFYFDYDINTVVKNYVMAIAPSQLWFLVMLFDVFIIAWFWSEFFVRHDFGGLIIVIGFYGVGLIGRHFFVNFFGIWNACKYIIFFWIGFEIRKCGSDAISKISPIVYIIADAFLFILKIWIEGMNGPMFTLLNLTMSFLLNVLGAVASFVVLQRIALHFEWENNRIFKSLKKISMTIYLFHQQIIYFFVYCFNGHLNPYIHALINFGGAMIISIIISYVLMSFKWTRCLVGEK
jgi:peptidoglycan/LPS O-acetylase OafA/YrhL